MCRAGSARRQAGALNRSHHYRTRASLRSLFPVPNHTHLISASPPPPCSCPVLQYCNITGGDASPELLPAGTCLQSTELVTKGRLSASLAAGPAVPWTGGQYQPQQQPGGGGVRRLRSADNLGDTEAAPLSLGRPGRQLAAAVDPLIWSKFSNKNNSFYRGPSLVGEVQATSEEECASACADSPLCEQWALCPATAAFG